MSVTITNVTQIGGPPPTSILVEGEFKSCEEVIVRADHCTLEKEIRYQHRVGDDWNVTFTVDPDCDCGKEITITAICGELGVGGFDTKTIKLCEEPTECPTVTADVRVGQCETDPSSPNFRYRPVTFDLTFTPPIPQNAATSVVINYGGVDAQMRPSSGSLSINTSAGPVASISHIAYLAHKPGGYTPSATVSVVKGSLVCLGIDVDFDNLPTSMPFVVLVDSCLPCPTSVEVKVTTPQTPDWCVPVNGVAIGVVQLEAEVKWPLGTVSPPLPTSFDWVITRPDMLGPQMQGTQAILSNVPVDPTGKSSVNTGANPNRMWSGAGSLNGAVNLNEVGTYEISAEAKFPTSAGLQTKPDGTQSCTLNGPGHFHLDACTPTVTPSCPTITVQATSSDCVDPASGKSATINFVAIVNDTAGIATGIDWDFGDPASGPANRTTTPARGANPFHTYSQPGSYLVTAKVNHAAPCTMQTGSSDTAQLALVVTACCPPGMSRDASGRCVSTPPTGSCGTLCQVACTALLILALLLLAAAAVATLVVTCRLIPPPTPTEIGAIAVAAAVGLGLLVLWGILCARFFCDLLNTIAWIFSFLASISAILAFIFRFISPPCSLGWLADAGLWGLALSIVGWISSITGCQIFRRRIF